MQLVLNKCYGGFGLSHKAIVRYFELKNWEMKMSYWDCESSAQVYIEEFDKSHIISYENEDGYFCSSDIERTDSILIQVINELGEEVDDWSSRLMIVEIPDNVEYYISDYDGVESVMRTGSKLA